MSPTARRAGTVAVFAACAAPIVLIGIDGLRGALGANPITEILNRLGFWTLVLLLATLLPTALRILTGWSGALRWRRMVGLFAFSCASLHFATYALVDQALDLPAIVEDITRRPFILVGFLALLLLVPLALTSTDRSVRRLGPVRWKRLHRLVYASAALGVVHFVWRVKADLREPLIFAGALTVLLALRVLSAITRRRR